MKILSYLITLVFCLSACSQKAKVADTPSSITLKPEDVSFLERCSRIDASLEEFWILLCFHPNHSQRQEIYEYSKAFKTFKRLTFQDGQITDLAVRDHEDIYYASSYDASKEQFIEILKGQKPGTDIYLKKRNQSYFERLTALPGVEKDPYFSKEFYKLYFVHVHKGINTLMSLDKNQKQYTHHMSKSSQIYSPVVLGKEKTLYWLEVANGKAAYTLHRKTTDQSKIIFKSASRILMMRPDHAGETLLIAFTTGLGRDIWNFNPSNNCWQLKLRSVAKWDFFQPVNEKDVFISLEDNKGLQVQSLQIPENTCEPSPPGLGVEIVQ